MKTTSEALSFLLEFVDYEKVTKFKYDVTTFNLGRVEELMAAAGNPHRAFRSVHIAGTKGKGSTAAMAQSILTAAGFRTGLFTSPHLCRVEERMTVDGEMMSEAELVEIVNDLAPYTLRMRAETPNESPTFFELVTATGFRHFARRGVEFAVVEVGLGGRLDATNVIRPEVSVITRVDLDHVERLGNTLGRIAFEKAGIIKPGVPVVCAPQEPDALATITRVAAERGSLLTLIGRDYQLGGVQTGAGPEGPFCRFDLAGPRRRYERLALPLLGAHQAANAAAAVAALEILEERCGLTLGDANIRRGLETARCPARLEFFPGQPAALLDSAHNPVSIRTLCDTLDAVFPERKMVLVMGFSRDKDIAAMLKSILAAAPQAAGLDRDARSNGELHDAGTHAACRGSRPRAAKVVFTRSNSPRAAEPAVLAEMARELCGVQAEVRENPEHALSRARELAGEDDLICITGSFYLAGQLRGLLAEPDPRTGTSS